MLNLKMKFADRLILVKTWLSDGIRHLSALPDVRPVVPWAILICLGAIALHLRTPLVARYRPWDMVLVSGVGAFFCIRTVFFLYHEDPSRFRRIEQMVFVLSIVLILGTAVKTEGEFHYKKHRVLNHSPGQLQRLGQHFIVGYRDYDDIRKLVSKGAVGGVYITTRNIRGKSFDTVRQEIQDLQEIQQSNGLPPLFIAADQEGGIVSRMTPPLTGLPPLSEIMANEKTPDAIEKRAAQYAAIQGKELARLGININFSPVVDLENKKRHTRFDSRTKLNQRTISGDQDIVCRTALSYCMELEKYGVFPTLKHFPGLSAVMEDTHFFAGELDTDPAVLSQKDWLPFREVSGRTHAFIMLGHVRLTALDRRDLTSFSSRIIQGVIRNEWQHDGILITDDLNMGAVAGSEFGIRGVALKALNAGVDLLLISYDGDQYYDAMYGLITAADNNTLDAAMLAKSSARLEKARAGFRPASQMAFVY